MSVHSKIQDMLNINRKPTISGQHIPHRWLFAYIDTQRKVCMQELLHIYQDISMYSRQTLTHQSGEVRDKRMRKQAAVWSADILLPLHHHAFLHRLIYSLFPSHRFSSFNSIFKNQHTRLFSSKIFFLLWFLSSLISHFLLKLFIIKQKSKTEHSCK